MFKKGQPVRIPFCNKEGVVEHESQIGNSYLVGVILLKAKGITIARTLKWYQVKDLEAMETDKPWELWEFNVITPDNKVIGNWLPCQESPIWESRIFIYRRKQKTIRIGNYDVPEPLRVAPEKGTTYFVPSLIEFLTRRVFSIDDAYYLPVTWSGCYDDLKNLELGLAQRTKEAAELHAKALLSFTTMEINDE